MFTDKFIRPAESHYCAQGLIADMAGQESASIPALDV